MKMGKINIDNCDTVEIRNCRLSEITIGEVRTQGIITGCWVDKMDVPPGDKIVLKNCTIGPRTGII